MFRLTGEKSFLSYPSFILNLFKLGLKNNVERVINTRFYYKGRIKAIIINGILLNGVLHNGGFITAIIIGITTRLVKPY